MIWTSTRHYHSETKFISFEQACFSLNSSYSDLFHPSARAEPCYHFIYQYSWTIDWWEEEVVIMHLQGSKLKWSRRLSQTFTCRMLTSSNTDFYFRYWGHSCSFCMSSLKLSEAYFKIAMIPYSISQGKTLKSPFQSWEFYRVNGVNEDFLFEINARTQDSLLTNLGEQDKVVRSSIVLNQRLI